MLNEGRDGAADATCVAYYASFSEVSSKDFAQRSLNLLKKAALGHFHSRYRGISSSDTTTTSKQAPAGPWQQQAPWQQQVHGSSRLESTLKAYVWCFSTTILESGHGIGFILTIMVHLLPTERASVGVNVSFNMGVPFKPFDQLMGVLPPRRFNSVVIFKEWLLAWSAGTDARSGGGGGSGIVIFNSQQ